MSTKLKILLGTSLLYILMIAQVLVNKVKIF